jgi:hypothetical protein
MFVIVLALLMVYAVLPSSAHAASLTDAQAQAVTNLLSSFGVDQSTINNVSLVLKGASKEDIVKAMGQKTDQKFDGRDLERGGAPMCGMIARALKRGSNGDDVSQLQAFLQRAGDFKEASTTGFFGPATERALQAWQARTGIVQNGDADSTGFGALGPQTRAAIMMHCGKEMNGDNRPPMMGTSTPMKNDDMSWHGMQATTTLPTCTLTASAATIQAGQSVELRWQSQNATFASSANGGRGPVSGTISVRPGETTTYVKHVYSPAGQGECSATVMVGDDATPAPQPRLVIVPTTINVGHVFSLMGSGMAAVMDGYLSLFGLSLE